MARPSRVSTSCQPRAWYSPGSCVLTNITATPKACAWRSAARMSRLVMPWRRCVTCILQTVDPEPDHVGEWAGVAAERQAARQPGATQGQQWRRWRRWRGAEPGRIEGIEGIVGIEDPPFGDEAVVQLGKVVRTW